MIQLPREFREFLNSLNSKGVEYLLIGGYAVAHHGYPRATNDLDVWIASTPDNADRVVEAVAEFGFEEVREERARFTSENQVVRMGVPPLRIEILTSIDGVSFDACYPARVTATFDDVEVNLICLRDLKTNKRASGRLKDLGDLEQLP